jgi:rSAM/selenodomain-associated transferase 2
MATILSHHENKTRTFEIFSRIGKGPGTGHDGVMLSVIIPTLNAAHTLPACFDTVRPLAHEIIVSDGGSSDGTVELARRMGARLISGPPGRGGQLRRGADMATGRWLLFLHADTLMTSEGTKACQAYDDETCAAVFRLRFDDTRWRARIVAAAANIRTRMLGLPYGDQGLLISRPLYDAVGGFADMPLMEDVDMARRLKGRLTLLNAHVITAADRYRRDGYARRLLKNWGCMTRYLLGASPDALRDRYQA